MKLVDAAAAILTTTGGGALSSREIVDLAIEQGLISPRSAKPWVQLAGAIRQHNIRLELAGKMPEFVSVNGKWKLHQI